MVLRHRRIRRYMQLHKGLFLVSTPLTRCPSPQAHWSSLIQSTTPIRPSACIHKQKHNKKLRLKQQTPKDHVTHVLAQQIPRNIYQQNLHQYIPCTKNTLQMVLPSNDSQVPLLQNTHPCRSPSSRLAVP